MNHTTLLTQKELNIIKIVEIPAEFRTNLTKLVFVYLT